MSVTRHAAELRESFAPYIAAGRRAGRAGAPSRRRGRRSAGGVDPAAVRAWARSHNLKVSERGRISAELLTRYAASKASCRPHVGGSAGRDQWFSHGLNRDGYPRRRGL